MELFGELRELADHSGIDYAGVADLAQAHDAVVEQGGPLVEGFPRCISLGIVLLDTIVDQLPNRSDRAVAVNYRLHAYDIINQRLDLAASLISGYLQQKGYRALPIPAAEHADDVRICASFSHKLGAHLAGLGWIGKSCLLVTPQHGPRVRFASILTDAPLASTGVLMEEQCGNCTECVEICPQQAFSGRPFRDDEPREARYDARRCQSYFNSMRDSGQLPVCGLCLYVCPYGKR
ncbi:MAG: 4Fe-4S double cluster binding domain-containing protein [Thermacetogeniaceae bacterium]